MTLELNVALIHKLYTWVTDVLDLFFWHVIYRCVYNQALADVRSTGAGIKYIFCITLHVVAKTQESSFGSVCYRFGV